MSIKCGLVLLIPDRLPRLKIGQFQPEPGHAALVDVLQGFQNHFNEDLLIVLRYQFICQAQNILCWWHPTVPDNCLHDQDQCLSIADTQGIGLSHCLRDCKVSLTRTFIGPAEYIPQQINLIEFIHGQSAINVRPLGHVDKGEGTQERTSLICHALVSRVNKKCQAQNFLLKKLLIVISQSVSNTPDMTTVRPK